MDYNPYDAAQIQWVGLKHFQDLLTRPQFLQVFGNTLYISILKMVCGFGSDHPCVDDEQR